MKSINQGGKIITSEIGLGCMRINNLNKTEIDNYVRTSLELGINLFDHADIYGGGECESIFADAIEMTPNLREKMVLQTKCSIRPGISYDLSKEHILSSADGSLNRLQTDYIDIFLLHRPDALVEPEEVAEAFSILKQSGKVKYFGVSNHNSYQIALLNSYLGDNNIIANQMQLSIPTCPMIDLGINVNTGKSEAVSRDSGTLDYCRLHNISIQAWSPFQYGFFEGTFIGSEKYPELNEKLDEIAAKYDVTPSAVAVAWILRHPSKMQVIVGTTKVTRLKEICKASDFSLTREEWYALYKAAGKTLP